MDLQLTGKRAFVSGSTAGIGFAIAQALAKEGAQVMVNGRTEERVRQALDKLKGSGLEAGGIAADLGTAAGVAEVVQRFPEIEILVNNVGIFDPKPFEAIPDSDWLRFFEVNVMSGVRLHDQDGQLAVSRGLAETTAGTGVTVNAVLPGPTASEGVEEFVAGMAAQQKKNPAEVEKEFFRTVKALRNARRSGGNGHVRL